MRVQRRAGQTRRGRDADPKVFHLFLPLIELPAHYNLRSLGDGIGLGVRKCEDLLFMLEAKTL